MLIGSWGQLVFEVSGIGALTFTEISQDASGRWTIHEPINTAPVSEFLGPGQDEVKLKIILSRMLGADPKDSYELLRQLVRKGMNFPLILQGTPMSGSMWYINSIGAVTKTFSPGTGAMLWTEFTCQFKEYN